MPKFAPEEWKQVFELLDRALDLPADERESWLAALELTRPQLHPALLELLARHAKHETGDFLQGLPKFTQVDIAPSARGLLKAGEEIGPYRLLHEIGHGGMGSVWLAERADGQLKRAVALKLPHVGWTGRLAEQMERERDILAALEHPNIARLYDAGFDASGRPFLAMEYVEGQPIDEYCRERQLGIDACLRLVLEVAKAVAHAHSKLVVHRDLKPSNVLVSADGSVRLLDFGIARLLAGDAVRETQLGSRALTPDYASPEQIRGDSIGTATDVYSLAVVCYELLTGSRPYRLPRGSAAELEQAIAEADPLPASAATADQGRKRRLRGDLDAILNKALKKDPQERYTTIDAFAQDVGRHLGGLPVQARPDSRAYRFGRFITRHKTGTAASAAVVVAIVAGALVSIWQAGVAKEQARRAEAINAFILSLFKAAGPGGGGGADLRVTELLNQSLPRIERELSSEPRRQIELYTTVADGLRELNAYPESIVAYDKGRELATHEHLLQTDAAIEGQIGKADALVALDRLKEAGTILDEVERSLRAMPPGQHLANLWMVRSYLKLNAREPQEAVKAAQAGADLIGQLRGKQTIEYLQALRELTRAQYHADQCEQALPNIDYALRQLPLTVGSDTHPEIMTIRGVRARCLKDLQRYDESLADFERNDAEVQAVYGARSKDYAIELLEHATVERSRGNTDAAIPLTRRSLEILDERGVKGGYSVAGGNALLVLSLAQGRDLVAAESAAHHYHDVAIETFGPDDHEVLVADVYLALIRGLQGDLKYAVPRFSELIRNMPPQGEPYRARSQSLLAWLLLLNGDAKQAVTTRDETLTAMEARGVFDAGWLAIARARYGVADLELGQLDRAQQELERALKDHTSLLSVTTPDRADMWIGLARLHLQLNHAEQALSFARQADEFWSRHDPKSRWSGEAAYWTARALQATGQRQLAAAAFARAAPLLKTSPFRIDAQLAAGATSATPPSAPASGPALPSAPSPRG